MLNQVADGVQVHESRFVQSNAVVVQGKTCVLVIDVGVHGDELACLVEDLAESRQSVVAGCGRSREGRRNSGRCSARPDRRDLRSPGRRHAHPVGRPSVNRPRADPSSKAGWEWVADLHAGQVKRLAQRDGQAGTPA